MQRIIRPLVYPATEVTLPLRTPDELCTQGIRPRFAQWQVQVPWLYLQPLSPGARRLDPALHQPRTALQLPVGIQAAFFMVFHAVCMLHVTHLTLPSLYVQTLSQHIYIYANKHLHVPHVILLVQITAVCQHVWLEATYMHAIQLGFLIFVLSIFSSPWWPCHKWTPSGFWIFLQLYVFS